MNSPITFEHNYPEDAWVMIETPHTQQLGPESSNVVDSNPPQEVNFRIPIFPNCCLPCLKYTSLALFLFQNKKIKSFVSYIIFLFFISFLQSRPSWFPKTRDWCSYTDITKQVPLQNISTKLNLILIPTQTQQHLTLVTRYNKTYRSIITIVTAASISGKLDAFRSNTI